MKKKRFYLSFALPIIMLAVFLFSTHSAAFAGNVVSWGLKYNANGTPPTPSAQGAKLLKDNNGLFIASNEKVYFTFDLGYEAGYTAEVLDILKAHDIKAVFFLCGNYLKETELVKRMIDEGHSIGNHTDKHKDLPTLSEESAKKDILDFDTKFKEQYGNTTLKFFRPPQGRFDDKTLKITSGQNLKTLLWSIAIVDWNKKPIDDVTSAEKVMSRMHKGAIILFHISNSGMPKTLNRLIPQLKEQGYQIGSPDEFV